MAQVRRAGTKVAERRKREFATLLDASLRSDFSVEAGRRIALNLVAIATSHLTARTGAECRVRTVAATAVDRCRDAARISAARLRVEIARNTGGGWTLDGEAIIASQ